MNKSQSTGTEADAGGILAQVPVDAHAKVQVGSTANAGAGLVTGSRVVTHKLKGAFRDTINKWLLGNYSTLMDKHTDDITESGIWIIKSTCVTQNYRVVI